MLTTFANSISFLDVVGAVVTVSSALIGFYLVWHGVRAVLKVLREA